MPSIDRDRNIVRHILKYCDEVNTAHEDFDCSRKKFMSSSTYRNVITMPILQIVAVQYLSDFRVGKAEVLVKTGVRNG